MFNSETIIKAIVVRLQKYLEDNNAYWKWNGHKHVAELTSGKLSDFFANLTPLFSNIDLQQKVASALVSKLFSEEEGFPKLKILPENTWVVGAAMGSIGLAQSLAYEFCHNIRQDVRCAYTEKTEPIFVNGAAQSQGMELKRFDLGKAPYVILCEDVTTTGGTSKKTFNEIHKKHPDASFLPWVFSVVDRSVILPLLEDDGFKITSLIRVRPRIWNHVEDLPEEMKDCIPLRPKGNWKKLAEEML